MDNLKQHAQINKRCFLFICAWIFFWTFPWGKMFFVESNLYLNFVVDILKIGLALIMFILPGVWLYLLLRQAGVSLAGLRELFSVGFALSVALLALIGIIGRVFGFSFILVKNIFMLIGLGELILLTHFHLDFSVRKEQLLAIFSNLFKNILLLLALILAVSMAFNEFLFFIDDTTYAAYSMNWQSAVSLGFDNIVHRAGEVENPRFWLALYPMVHSLLSDISGVPVILLYSHYLELFLVPFSVIIMYWFARTLGLSSRLSGFAALIQVILYIWMIGESWPVGFWFFLNMAEDKVSAVFLLSPVFFVFVLKYIQAPIKSNLILTLISGIGLALTHPAILFFSCFVAAGMGGGALFSKKTSWRMLLSLAVIFFLIILPYIAIRLYDHPSLRKIPFDGRSASDTFQIEKYTNVVNDVFYGLNPEVLKFFDISPDNSIYAPYQVFRLFPVFLALTAGVLAFVRIKNGALYWYILTCVLLVAFATIPYTGWILGYFVSARLISRASWFSPLGLAGALILSSIIERLKLRSSLVQYMRSTNRGASQKVQVYAGILAGLAFFTVMLIFNILPRTSSYFTLLDHYRQLAQVGAYMDENDSTPVTMIALNYEDTQMLPSISANANLISFREEKEYNPHNYFFSLEDIRERMDASNAIRSVDDSSINLEKRCSLLKKYDVTYVVAWRENATSFLNLYAGCDEEFADVFQTKDIILLLRK